MDSEFKYLCNPTDSEFVFQYDSQIYSVPPKSRKLFLAVVADHGEKRSFGLSNPEFDEDTGEVIKTGNDVIKRCYTEEADVMNPIGSQAPIIIETSKDDSRNVDDLFKGLSRPKRGRPKKTVINEVENVSA